MNASEGIAVCCVGGQCASLWLDGMETMLELIAWPDNEVGIRNLNTRAYHYYYSYICLTAFFSSTIRVSRHQKGKPFWILLKQEMIFPQFLCDIPLSSLICVPSFVQIRSGLGEL